MKVLKCSWPVGDEDGMWLCDGEVGEGELFYMRTENNSRVLEREVDAS